MELYFMRHGETAWALSGKHTGKTDIPLTAHGELESHALGGLLVDVKFDQVFSSPRQRARRTAELAGYRAPVIEPDLAEWDYGEYEGLRSVEILALRPDWDIYEYGCPSGESPTDVAARADRLIARWSLLSGRIGVFAHGHFGRVLAARWIGLPIVAAKYFALNTASYGVLDRDPALNHRPRIVRWNLTPTVPVSP